MPEGPKAALRAIGVYQYDSEAFIRFFASLQDIERLRDLHSEIGGSSRGRRYGLEVLNKSAIVLITAIWEAFCEDLASEAVKFLIDHVKKAEFLPKYLKQKIAIELKKDLNDLAIWRLTDDGWRSEIRTRLERLQAERNRRLNTPRSDEIDKLFREAIGLEKITNGWNLKNASANQARKKLDRYIELRGAIAHRGAALKPCRNDHVRDYFMHVRRLAGATLEEVRRFLTEITGIRWSTSLWEFAEANYPKDRKRAHARKRDEKTTPVTASRY